MYTRRLIFAAFFAAAILDAQEPEPSIQVTGAVSQPLTLTAADLAKMPRATVHTTSKGTETTFQGVWLTDVLKKAGVPQGAQLRGKALASCVIAEAQDGYQVAFSIGEVDPYYIDNQILLADTSNGKPLSGPQGRFHLVVPKDKEGARSVYLLTKLEIVQLRK